MNAPLKPPVIAEVLADACVSISNLKANPAAVVAEAQERAVAVLNRNRPVAYVISPEVWEYLQGLHEDALDTVLIEQRTGELDEAAPVALRDLLD